MSNSFFAATANSSSPYKTATTEILQLLEDAEIITSNNKKQAIALAKRYLDHNSDFISITWCVDDILMVADGRNLKLSQQQCKDVLLCLKDNHDASCGISWLTIECALDFLDFD
jgi:hypothetical protein